MSRRSPLVKAPYSWAQYLTVMTGELYVVDHIIPQSKGGRDHPRNLRVLTNRQNVAKGARPAEPSAVPFDPKNPRPTLAAAMEAVRARGGTPPGDWHPRLKGATAAPVRRATFSRT